MRCRRMCEKKPSGRINVDTKIVEQYKEGGESREVLEMALLECLAKHGVDRSSYKRIKADFVQKCKLIRERLESRQSEVHGRWMTAEAMKKSGLWSAQTIKQMISYCRKFPESLIRTWKYDDRVEEYFIIVEDKRMHMKAESLRDLQETDLGETWLSASCPPSPDYK
ncbi:unnamed protein product [Durusdinium trenchii]|uniref:Uncharacterized protein n=2 Tax=Durusdinium trenchii TaxID=1381693 RepID=A0ABP0LMG6_9DINO